MHFMRKTTHGLLAGLTIVLAACTSEPKFHVEGTVTDANEQTLYFEELGIEGVQTLDSVRLNEKGTFRFSARKPESPDFYRLRIGEKVVNFSIDSTETIRIEASLPRFASDYRVEGSENCSKIKELTLLQLGLQQDIDALAKAAKEGRLSRNGFEESMRDLVRNYKDTVRLHYIYAAPNQTYAYYALFQEVDGYLLFDPYNDRNDVKCFAAVATSLYNAYPHADRSKQLYNMVIKGMKNTRPAQPAQTIDESKINQSGIIDIALRDLKGNERRLSDLKGKVVLLDFTAYQTAVSVAHNFMLRELYDRYAAQGFEIYQVSFDPDEHFWRTSADNLPWTCVYEPAGVYSSTAAIYNVQQLPTFYLIDRNSELNARDEQIMDVEAAIQKLLAR